MSTRKNFLKKLYLAITLLTVAHQFGWSQTNGIYLPDSSNVYIPAGAIAGMWGDTIQVSGHLSMADSTSSVYFKGKVWSNKSTAAINGGRVVMNDTLTQTIIGAASYSGTGASFSRIEINNPAGINLQNSHVRIDSQIIFTKGLLRVNTSDVMLGPVATVLQTDSMSFAIVDTTGGVSKFYSSSNTFTFPVGSNISSAVYNPIQLNVKAPPGNYSSLSYVKVALKDKVNAGKSPLHNNYAQKYWTVAFRNLTIDSANYVANYNITDAMIGDTAQIVGSNLTGGRWWYQGSGRITGSGAPLVIKGKVKGDAEIFGQDKLLQVDMKVILEGAWNGSAMTTTLRNSNLLPMSQPYGVAPYNVATLNYAGDEKRLTLPSNAVDWVLLELRNTPTGPALFKAAGLLLNDGSISDGYIPGPVEFPNAAEGNYYVVVRHRNHLGVVSAATIGLPNATGYDFTTALSKGYGSGKQMAALSGGKFGLHGGNVIPDGAARSTGLLSINDYLKIQAVLGPGVTSLTNVYSQADVNLNGSIKSTGLPSSSDFILFSLYLGIGNSIITQSF